MYCPKCSQQVFEDASFCNRCGFHLSIVKELFVNNGLLPVPALEAQQGQAKPPRKAGRLGAKMMFFSIILLPVFFGLSVIFDSPVPLFVPATLFLAGVAWILYLRIFGEELWPAKPRTQPELSGESMNPATLQRAPSNVPARELMAKPANTAEIARPNSVVEHTTKLLNND
jgi:hypothetical protein